MRPRVSHSDTERGQAKHCQPMLLRFDSSNRGRVAVGIELSCTTAPQERERFQAFNFKIPVGQESSKIVC